MKISDLQDGQEVEARTGRAGRTNVEWNEWKPHILYVRFFTPRNKPPKLVTITLRDENWAEGSEDDFCPPEKDDQGGFFVVEDYYLQIKGLER